MSHDSKYDLIVMERQKALLELYLLSKKTEIQTTNETIESEELHLKQLQKTLERENIIFEEFLKENEKKSVEAKAFFEQEAKAKQQKNTEIKKLTSEIQVVESELERYEESLRDYKKIQKILFKLSPLEWQESKTKQDKSEEDPAAGEGQQSDKDAQPSSAQSDAENKSKHDDLEIEEDPELYFTDPQQLLDLVTELTEQNLSLYHISTRVEDTLKDLQQSIVATRQNIEKDAEPLKIQISDMETKIEKEKARGAKLKQKVQFLSSLNTEDQDSMLESLDAKVVEVQRCLVEDRSSNQTTLEKLATIENCMSTVLQGLEIMPEEILKMLKKIMDRERRTRQREENLREQRLKQEEKLKRYLERSLADCKKMTGRKLMARSRPFCKKVSKVSSMDTNAFEDEIHAYLYVSDDVE
ncbi:cilia- and flagella-associated protein 100 [Nelusetta ayraudi]|uniref:cilia- and flagella-associated protein 100 n=1 Tax=Nelusetta ayraudi TaxID=303726 RepID=UPI003F710F2A